MTYILQNNGCWSELPGDSVRFHDMAFVPTSANDPYHPRTHPGPCAAACYPAGR